MATIAKITSGANASSALNYALGKDQPMHEQTERWLEEHNLQRPPELANCRAVAIGGTNGVDPLIANDQFAVIRELHHQTQERNQVARITQSFALDELNPKNTQDWQRANELGVELAEKLYPQHQTAVYTHLDGQNHVLHNHIIVNKVNLETGNKLREVPGKTVEKARTINDQLAMKQDWRILPPPQERMSETEKDLVAKQEYSYMDDLRTRINEAMSEPSVSSYEALRDVLDQKGVIIQERGRSLSYAFLDANNKQRRARGARLGTDFEKETILNELENRARQTRTRPVEPVKRREPEVTGLVQAVKQPEPSLERRESTTNNLEQQLEQRKPSIARLIDTIQHLREQLPELTQRVKKHLVNAKEAIFDAFEKRFSSDMAQHKQEQRQALQQDLDQRMHEPAPPEIQPPTHDRGLSL
ncbi:relaxase/mobilization nuclease domain-containing protein [Enterococcus faecalis]